MRVAVRRLSALASFAISLCLAPTVAAAIDGINAETVRRMAVPETAQMANGARDGLNRVVQAARSLRANMATDPAALRAALESDEQIVVDALLAVDSSFEVARWRYFFRGSISVLGRAAGDRPLLAYYNPMSDAWVIFETTRSPRGGVRLDDVVVATGDQISGRRRDDGGELPFWVVQTTAAMPSALAFATGASIARFDERFPMMAAGGGPVDVAHEAGLVWRRIDLLGATLSTFRSDPGYRGLGDRIRAKIAAGDGRGLAAMTGEPDAPHRRALRRINLLGAPIRESFHLVGTFRHAGGMLVAFSSPLNGKWVVFADLDTAGATPVVNDLVAIDLAQLL